MYAYFRTAGINYTGVYDFNAFHTTASLDLIFFISADESLGWTGETI